MKFKYLALAFMLMTAGLAQGQEAQRAAVRPVQFYIGFRPGIMPANFVDQWGYSVWDLNLVPLDIVYALDRHWALRLHPIYNVGLGSYNQAATVSNFGFEISTPFYVSLKNSEEGHRSFYIAPVLTPGYHKLSDYYMLGIGAEAGFSLLFGNRWSLTLGAQGGFQIQKRTGDTFFRYIRYGLPVVSVGIWL
jgi:hypothetical protein